MRLLRSRNLSFRGFVCLFLLSLLLESRFYMAYFNLLLSRTTFAYFQYAKLIAEEIKRSQSTTVHLFYIPPTVSGKVRKVKDWIVTYFISELVIGHFPHFLPLFLSEARWSAHKGTNLHGTLSRLPLLGHHFMSNPKCMAILDWCIYRIWQITILMERTVTD